VAARLPVSDPFETVANGRCGAYEIAELCGFLRPNFWLYNSTLNAAATKLTLLAC